MTFSSIGRALLALSVLLSATAGAQGFSALVTPPRFEDSVKPGTVYRNVIEITNVSGQRANYLLKTADWELDASASAVFSDALAPASCRPWVGIEATEISIESNTKRRFRFEVAVPADAPSGECRFAIMLEGEPQAARGAVPVPVSGRIGIIVYIAIGDAAARFEVLGSQAQTVDGRVLPALRLRNNGNAHGRMEGLVDGKDGSGRSFSFAPSGVPILPGETRLVLLTPEGDNPDTPAPAIVYPLVLKGRLDWGSQRIDIATTVAQ